MASRLVRIVFKVDDAQAMRALRMLAGQAEETATATERAFNRTNNQLRTVGRAAESTGRMMTGVGLGLGAFGYYSAKAAVNFQQNMTRIRTQAGVGKDAVNAMSKSVLNFAESGQAMQGPNDLANALYHIASVGIRQTAPAMNVLKIASEGAAVGGSNLEDTASALAAAMVATHAPVSQAGRVMGILNATVGAGNMRMTDLVQALGRGMIPAFQQVGLNINDAMGALAVFTDAGYQASSAAAQVSTALHFLTNPTTKAQKALAAIGMTSTQMAQELHQPRGLLRALRDLKSHLDALPGGASGTEAGQVLGDIFPGGRGRIMLTLIQNLGRYQNKLDQVASTTGKFNEGFSAEKQTSMFKIHAALVQIQAAMVKFGSTLLPIIAKYLPDLTRLLSGFFNWITRLPGPVKEFLTKLSGFLIIGGPLLLFFGKLVTAYSQLRGAMFAIKAAGKAAFIGESAASAGLNLLDASIRKFAPLAAIYFGLQAAGKVPSAIQHHDAARSAIQGGILGASSGLLGTAAYGALTGSALGPLGLLAGAGVGLFAGAGAGLINSAFGARGGLVTPRGIRHLASGGPIGSDNVPAWLSAGEGVVSRVGMANLGVGGLAAINNGGLGGGGADINVTVPVYLNGREITRVVTQEVLRKAARGPSSLVGGSLLTGVRTG